MNKPIATVHWIDIDGVERSIEIETDKAVEDFTIGLQAAGVCYWTCLVDPKARIPNKASKRLVDRVS